MRRLSNSDHVFILIVAVVSVTAQLVATYLEVKTGIKVSITYSIFLVGFLIGVSAIAFSYRMKSRG